MRLFLIFLSLVSGIILFREDTYFIGIVFLLLVIFLLFYKKLNNKIKIYSLVALLIGIGLGNIKIQSFQTDNITGLVITKKDSYFILYDGLERFYVKNSDYSIKLYDIVKLEGSISELHFTTLESSFDFEEYLNNKGIYRAITIYKYSTIFSCPIDFEGYKENVINNFESEEVQSFVSAILFNDIDYSSSTYQTFDVLRITNLISLAGTFITFILYFVSNIVSFFVSEKFARWFSLVFSLPFLAFSFNTLTTQRVLLSYSLGTINKHHLKNKLERIEVISLCGIILIGLSAYNVFQMSFIIPMLLSFISNFAYLCFSRKKKLVKNLLSKGIMTLCFIPFMFNFYYSFNIVSLLLGSLLLPVFKIIFLLLNFSFYGVHFSFYNNVLSSILNFLKYFDARIFDINGPPFNQYIYVLYFGVLLIFIYFLEAGFKRFYKISFATVVGCLGVYCLPINNVLINEVSFINVGQGDSTLITYNGERYLIDTGGLTYKDIAQDVLINYFKSKKIYSIDYVFITHNDYDHYGALESLRENYNIKNVYYNSNDITNLDTKLNFVDLNVYKTSQDDENDKSMVLYFTIKSTNFLLMGDASSTIENLIIQNYKDLNVDILKVGHHGSSTSSSSNFISYIAPSEAVISCGENNYYGHPHESVLNTLEENNVTIRRTDLEGTITYSFSSIF